MNRKDSPQSVIDSYRRRQQMAPYFMAGLAVLLVVVGIIILVVWFTGSGKDKVGAVSLFPSATPTVTTTSTPTPVTPTATATITVTITISPTITQTTTPSGPFEYKVLDGDTCWDIALKNKVDLNVLLALNNFGTTCPIKPGDKIMIPQPGASLPTNTPISAAVVGKVEYIVQMGDTLASIAADHNSTVDAIMKENKIQDANKINVGDKLSITVNIITPTVTKAPTKTITPGGPTLTVTPAPSATATTKP
jgi:LysM repeat protein